MKSIVRNLDLLKVLSKANKKVRCALIRNGPCDLIHTLVECSLNVLQGRFKLTEDQIKKLSKFKNHIRKLDKKSSTQQRDILVQHGGFLQFILPAIISGIASIVSSAISSKSE